MNKILLILTCLGMGHAAVAAISGEVIARSLPNVSVKYSCKVVGRELYQSGFMSFLRTSIQVDSDGVSEVDAAIKAVTSDYTTIHKENIFGNKPGILTKINSKFIVVDSVECIEKK